MVSVPRDAICKTVTAEQIEAIEKKLEVVRENKEEKGRHGVDAKDVINEQDFVQVVDVPVLLQYETGEEYRKVFNNLAKLENAFGQTTKEEELDTAYVYRETCAALKRFSKNKKSMDNRIYEIILGKRTIESPPDDPQLDISSYKAPNISSLNRSQALAIKHALENPLTLIQGGLLESSRI